MKALAGLLKSIFDFVVFSSLYIAICAVIMAIQASQLFHLPLEKNYLYFVFFSTMCSYNLHWFLTPEYATESIRIRWTHKNKDLHLLFFAAGLLGSVLFVFTLLPYILWIALGGLLTFLYTAPKIERKPFTHLKKVAIGKTIYLSFVWMYVTTILPFIISEQSWKMEYSLFSAGRFFFIYAICIIFDYRDREEDRKHGIRSLITYFNERGIRNLFAFSLIVYGLVSVVLYTFGISTIAIALLLIPGLITAILFDYSKKNFSDYHYYFVLDGLMMLPALLTMIFL